MRYGLFRALVRDLLGDRSHDIELAIQPLRVVLGERGAHGGPAIGIATLNSRLTKIA
jgi:hypothetical protein